MSKRPNLKYGFLLSILFILSDLNIVKKFIGVTVGMVVDVVIICLFLYPIFLIVKKIRSDKSQKYSFWIGYGKGIMLGLSAIGYYLLLNMVIMAVSSATTMDFLGAVIGKFPVFIFSSVIRMFLISMIAFLIPIYHLINKEKKDRGELDGIIYKE